MYTNAHKQYITVSYTHMYAHTHTLITYTHIENQEKVWGTDNMNMNIINYEQAKNKQNKEKPKERHTDNLIPIPPPLQLCYGGHINYKQNWAVLVS